MHKQKLNCFRQIACVFGKSVRHCIMKINNGGLYYSKSNNLVVRVVRAIQAESIAYIKCHNRTVNAFGLSFESEVAFSDLEIATKESVLKYLGK